MIKLYGLDSCDTCKKTQNWLKRFSIEFQFIDYRAQRIEPEMLKQWADAAGGFVSLINKASTTWRQLPDTRKNPGSAPEWLLLLKEYPALIKRPVLTKNGQWVMQGFTDNAYKKYFEILK
jgi:Spx/MgsR family transcriptional regulator